MFHWRDLKLNRVNATRAKADSGWKREFDDPVLLPDGRQLVTLKDAADYITHLPSADPEIELMRYSSRKG